MLEVMFKSISQQTITCSKSKIETVERCGICSELTVKTPGRRRAIFIVNFEQISHFFLEFQVLTLNTQTSAGR